MNSYAEITAYLWQHCLWTWCVSNFKSEHYEHTKVHVPFRNWVWILLVSSEWSWTNDDHLFVRAVQQQMPHWRRRQKRRQRRAMKQRRSSYIIYYSIARRPMSGARTMTMYYLPSPEFVVTARDGIRNKLLGIRGPSSGRHGREVLLAAHFVSVLCVVLHFTWPSKDMNSYHINSYVHMNSYIMQNKNSLPLTDHVNCTSWRFFGFYFF